MNKLAELIPFFSWIRSYKKSFLAGDISAGLTVGIMLIPQGMAYASIAELPVEYGLYAALVPQIIYMLLGTSRQLSVGPVAMDSLLVATIVSTMAKSPEHYIELAILLAFTMGVIQFIFGLLRFGFLVNFLSKPVITGFTSAAAVIIGLNQIKHLTGASIDRNSNVMLLMKDIISSVSEFHLASLLIGIVGIVVLVAVKRYLKRIPGALILVVFGTLLLYILNVQGIDLGVKVVEHIPSGLPPVKFPDLTDFGLFQEMLLPALTIALIAFMESISVAKAIEEKHQDYAIDANKELIALGMSNIVGSIFSSYSVTGGFSRSAVNDQSGAKTGIAALISATLIFLTLLFLTGSFYFLPKTLLSSIILVAVYGLIDFKTPFAIWKTNKIEFLIYLITLLSTLILGIQQGIILGVLLSLLVIIYHVSYPHVAEIGKLKGTGEYMNIERYNEANSEEGLLIIRLDARLFYANMSHLKSKIEEFLERREDKIEAIILTTKAMNGIDYSGIKLLEELISQYKLKGVKVYFTALKGPVRDRLKRSGFIEKYGETNCFLSIDNAIAYHRSGKHEASDKAIYQSNN